MTKVTNMPRSTRSLADRPEIDPHHLEPAHGVAQQGALDRHDRPQYDLGGAAASAVGRVRRAGALASGGALRQLVAITLRASPRRWHVCIEEGVGLLIFLNALA